MSEIMHDYYDSSDYNSEDEMEIEQIDNDPNIHIPRTNLKFTNESSGSDNSDEDDELQEAYLDGKLVEGLNVKVVGKKVFVNDEAGMKEYLQKTKLDLDWIERLDVTPTLPEISEQLKLEEETVKSEHDLMGDKVHDDFKRELTFYRQAQATAIIGMAKLKELKVPTLRPEDYFAEMLKSDNHMDRIRKKIIQKRKERENVEKLKKLRQQKMMGKMIQHDVLKRRREERKQYLENIKKMKKGSKDEDGASGKTKGHQVNAKRDYKNQKYGFGGQKKRMMMNTKESFNDMGDYQFKSDGTVVRNKKLREMKEKVFNKKGGKGGKGNKTHGGKSNRPGKDTRAKNKSRRKN